MKCYVMRHSGKNLAVTEEFSSKSQLNLGEYKCRTMFSKGFIGHMHAKQNGGKSH